MSYFFLFSYFWFAESLQQILVPSSPENVPLAIKTILKKLHFGVFLYLLWLFFASSFSQLGSTWPSLAQLAQTWLDAGWLSLVLVSSLSQCTGASWEFALESLKLPFFSGVFCPSEANYCSNPFEVSCWLLHEWPLL